MLSGDERRLAMALSLLFALPGTPVLWYGDEIGMGEDLSLPERNSVRTPMQWADEPNAGFSTAPADRLVRPVVSQGPFRYQDVNVAAQRGLSSSPMERLTRLIRTRRACPEIGWGTCGILRTGEAGVLALRCDWRGGSVVTLHNLADRDAKVRIDLNGASRLMPLVCSDDRRVRHDPDAPVPLEPYGFRWFRVDGERRWTPLAAIVRRRILPPGGRRSFGKGSLRRAFRRSPLAAQGSGAIEVRAEISQAGVAHDRDNRRVRPKPLRHLQRERHARVASDLNGDLAEMRTRGKAREGCWSVLKDEATLIENRAQPGGHKGAQHGLEVLA
jgi:hypothetical protein